MKHSSWMTNPEILIEFGNAYSKVGFAGEPLPRVILETSELRLARINFKHSESLKSQTLSISLWTEILYKLLHVIFFKHLRTDPCDHCVNVAETNLLDIQFKSSLTQLLFETFGVPAIRYLPSSATALYVSGVPTGLVIDVGYTETRILPVCFGIPIYSAHQLVPLGSYLVDRSLKDMLAKNLQKDSTSNDLSEESQAKQLSPELVENIKVQGCYCRVECNNPENSESSFSFSSSREYIYGQGTNRHLTIPPDLRWEPCEVLFQTESSLHMSLVEGVLRALELCPCDVKSCVIRNILLCGGIVDLNGFPQRFSLELWRALRAHPQLNTSRIMKAAAVSTPTVPGFVRQWVGASLCVGMAQNFQCLIDVIEPKMCKEIEISLCDWIVPEKMLVCEASTSEEILLNATRLDSCEK